MGKKTAKTKKKTKKTKKIAKKPTENADGVPVYCSFMELVKVEELKGNPRNPNKHPAEQIRRLARNIKNFGWRVPITVSCQSGLIVRGHGRLDAALKMGVRVVPVDYQYYESKEEEWLDMLADNRIPELAETDIDLMCGLLKDLEGAGVDETLAGFELEEINELFAGMEEQEENEEEVLLEQAIQMRPNREYVVILCDEDEGYQFDKLKNLLGLRMVRRGGYKRGSQFDHINIQRVYPAKDLIKKLERKK